MDGPDKSDHVVLDARRERFPSRFVARKLGEHRTGDRRQQPLLGLGLQPLGARCRYAEQYAVRVHDRPVESGEEFMQQLDLPGSRRSRRRLCGGGE
jgi:hypothetical protein